MSYIRYRRPPLLAVWGKNDPFFLPTGAEAFKPRRFARHLFRQIQENRHPVHVSDATLIRVQQLLHRCDVVPGKTCT